MAGQLTATRFLEDEARALLVRLAHVQPFALTTPMVAAATVSPAAETAMENHLLEGRRRLRGRIAGYLDWLRGPEGRKAPLASAQKPLVLLKLRFNAVISQFYIFAAVLTQRSEHGTGVWVAGLDDLAADALSIPGAYYTPPPVVCFVDRGHGGAIRRARTRLPGGDPNPVAIIRVPHERMIGSGIASSVVHETGHQAAELLGLINPLRALLQERQKAGRDAAVLWRFWERWIGEIVADFWGVANVGIASTLGLISLVTLPRAFVFRVNTEDPHPVPWLRVKLSCAMGEALYPHQQWAETTRLWDDLYPLTGLSPETGDLLAKLAATVPEFVALLVNFRPAALRGKSLKEVMPLAARQPAGLADLFRSWSEAPDRMRSAAPTLIFAAIGQARADGKISPEEEGRVLTKLLEYWAMRSALDTSAICATQPKLQLAQQPPSLGRAGNVTLR